MQLGGGLQLLAVGFPVSLARTLHHHGRHGLQGGRVHPLEILSDAQLLLVGHIESVKVVIEFFVDGRRACGIPSEDVAEHLAKLLCGALVALHVLLDIGGVEQGCPCLYGHGLARVLHPAVAAVAVVGHISLGLFAGERLHRQRQAARELIHMVERQRSPRVALPWLYHHVGLVECGGKEVFLKTAPVLVVAINGAHIVQVALGQFRGFVPCAASFNIVHHARAVAIVHWSEHTHGGQLAGPFGCHALAHELLLLVECSLVHVVVVLVVGGRGQLHCVGNQAQARSGNVAQLSAHLHQYVHTRTAQLLARHQPQVADASLGVARGLYAQHPQGLGDGGSLCVDKLAGPERIAHLARPLSVLCFIALQRVLGQPFAVFPCLWVGSVLGVDAVHVASRGQHVRIQYGVAARCRLYGSAVQRTHHIVYLGMRRGDEQLIYLAWRMCAVCRRGFPLSVGLLCRGPRRSGYLGQNLLACPGQVVMGHVGIVLQLLGGDASLVAVAPCHLVGCRISTHGHHRVAQVLLAVGLSHGVVGSLHLLVRELFQVGIQAFQLALCIGRVEIAVEVQFPVESFLCDAPFDAHHQRPVAAATLHGAMDVGQQGGIFLAQSALGVRSSEIGQQRGMAAALGNDALAHIARGVEVEVRQVAHQHGTPVVASHAGVASGQILHVAVCAEVDERVGLEPSQHI